MHHETYAYFKNIGNIQIDLDYRQTRFPSLVTEWWYILYSVNRVTFQFHAIFSILRHQVLIDLRNILDLCIQ